MSYTTPIETTTAFKDLEMKLQNLSAGVKGKLSWLTYAFGLADRTVKTVDKKPYIFPSIYQDINAKDPLSLLPSDFSPAFCFWTAEEATRPEYNFVRIWYKVACIFYCDLKHIAPTTNYKLTRTKIRQDIIEAFRQNQYTGQGVLIHKNIIEDDLVKIYDGFSIDQVENKYKMLPKYAIRFEFDFGLLRSCLGTYNTYS